MKKPHYHANELLDVMYALARGHNPAVAREMVTFDTDEDRWRRAVEYGALRIRRVL